MSNILDDKTKQALNEALNTILPSLANDLKSSVTSQGGHTVTDIDQLTEAKLDGGGVFDMLMKASKAHIQEEFEQNRIVGADYAQLYLGTMQAAMQNSVAFLVQWDKRLYEQLGLLGTLLNTLAQQEVIDAQRALYEQQVVTEASKTNDAVDSSTLMQDVPIAPSGPIAGSTGLANLQISEQIKQITAQIGLTNNQSDKVTKDTLEVVEQTRLVANQADQVLVNKSLVAQQLVTEVAKTNDVIDPKTIVVDAPVAPSGQVAGQVGRTNASTEAQTAVVGQRLATERANTQDVTEGVLGAKISLTKQQQAGLKSDSIQKATKILADAYGVALANNSLQTVPSKDGVSQSIADAINESYADNLQVPQDGHDFTRTDLDKSDVIA